MTDLSEPQKRFLALHVHHAVERWTWHFRETMLRAQSGGRRSACIWRDELQGLLDAGLMEQGLGVDVRVTEAGREAANSLKGQKETT